MGIGNMKHQDQVMIQEAKMVGGNYSVKWLAAVHHHDILVCIKSSWMTYDELEQLLMSHSNEMRYQDEGVYWQKVTRQTSLKVPSTTVIAPVDIILLPIEHNEILFPSDKSECVKIQKTIKGTIKCQKKRDVSLFSLNAMEHFKFSNDYLPFSEDEIVAEYMVEDFKYPVTKGMLNKMIDIQIPRSSTCQLYITKNMSNKYNLKVSED